MLRRRPEAEAKSGAWAEAADRRAALALVPVSRETEDRLALYADRLKRWQAIKNLVGPSTLAAVWTRHIADSGQLLAFAPGGLRWVDLGSGAGFPGLVIAIMLADTPGARVDLVEANNRKCAFLREVARETGAQARVHAGRIEAVLPTLGEGVDVVTSRALAPVAALIDLAAPLLTAGAQGLFLSGSEAGEPAEKNYPGAMPGWDVNIRQSITHPDGRIAVVRRSGS